MRIHCIVAAGALAALVAGQARADTQPQHYYLQTGSDLEQVCANPANVKDIQNAERERLLVCGSYIQGFLGHYGLVRRELTSAPFCLPQSGVTAEKVRIIFLALLQQKPQIRDLPASVDLATSLAWGYACPRTASGTKQGGTAKPAATH
ncbi:Rap1a/Tai family immunity protein [Parvibaculum sp.]|uniref:Rap1a/Tai family immunity protein n=1 Tax=Parvibaculum sp. TaxID=2024848 RepID=UPI002CBB4BCD|nr:Rap1a/Tai family immunity protein [Parvibaculum sp.]HUD51914.1 Rap1a/Tai family immunity protein [Parvibaculum sp.]